MLYQHGGFLVLFDLKWYVDTISIVCAALYFMGYVQNFARFSYVYYASCYHHLSKYGFSVSGLICVDLDHVDVTSVNSCYTQEFKVYLRKRLRSMKISVSC